MRRWGLIAITCVLAAAHVAAALTCYLLEGRDRELRARFTDLLQAAHQSRATQASVAACFEGVDLDLVSVEFLDFCKAIELDD